MDANELERLLGDYAVFVDEPEYSRRQLLRFQEKYRMGTRVFQWQYGKARVDWPGSEEDRREWLYWAEIFTLAGGRMEDVDPEARDGLESLDPGGPEDIVPWQASEAPGELLLGASTLFAEPRVAGLRVS